MSATDFPIDIVLPVYDALDDVRRCVESVLSHSTPPFRLVVVDDASPDPRVREYLDGLAVPGPRPITLLRNGTNLGFVGAANRGMEESRADVLLLNSDTIVGSRWLDKLRRCASSDQRIGTVTPFSNNAEICSFPGFCVDNRWSEADDLELVNRALEDVSAATYPELPTGVGFCMLIRRSVLDRCGTFDPAFGRGYGEENDLCRRAAKAGFRNVLCEDTFVVHTGGRSFKGEKERLGERNLALLLARHPEYVDLVTRYIADDPVGPLRRLAAARLRALASPLAGVVHVLHSAERGGTEVQVRTLIAGHSTQLRGYLVVVRGNHWIVEEKIGVPSEGVDEGVTPPGAPPEKSIPPIEFDRPEGEPLERFIARLASTFRADLVHLHNISGARDALVDALPRCGVRYGYTAHDLSFACPMITFMAPGVKYCGAEKSVARCNACVGHHPNLAGVEVGHWRATHRELLERASFVVAPSRWAAGTLQDYFGGLPITVVPHAVPAPCRTAPLPLRTAVVLPHDGVPTVAVIGAVGPDKGARRLERLIALSRERRACLRWVVIGYVDWTRGPLIEPDGMLVIHGAYERDDLPDLLAHYRTRLVAFPSAGPETFSLTLSEVWSAGYPVVVPPIGALGERVLEARGGWVFDDWQDDRRVLEQILSILHPSRTEEYDTVRESVRGMSLPSVNAMCQATLECYPAFTRPVEMDPIPLTSASLAGWTRSFAHGAASTDPEPTEGLPEPRTRRDDSPRREALGSVKARSRLMETAVPGRVVRFLARTSLGRVLASKIPARLRDALRTRLL